MITITTLGQLIQTLEQIAPPSLAIPGDPIGLQFGPMDPDILSSRKIKRVSISVTPTPKTIVHAAAKDADLLITYHPLILEPIQTIIGEYHNLIKLLAKNNLYHYAAHTNWSAAPNGVNDTLLAVLGFTVDTILQFSFSGNEIPLGRICSVKRPITLETLVRIINDKLKQKHITYIGSPNTEVQKIAVVAGDGDNPSWLRRAKQMGADTYLTGETSQRLEQLAQQHKINLVCADHFATVYPGMRRLGQLIQMEHAKIDIVMVEGEPASQTMYFL